MQYKTIKDIINSGKFTETKFRYDYKKPYGVQIQQEAKKLGLPEDYYTIYVTNIFLDTHKEKYKNTKVLEGFVIKNWYGQVNGEDTYRLVLTGKELWEDYYRYSDIDDLAGVLENGVSVRYRTCCDTTLKETTDHKYLKLWDNKAEAAAYIKQYKVEKDLTKYNIQLNTVRAKIKELQEEEQKLVATIEKINGKTK